MFPEGQDLEQSNVRGDDRRKARMEIAIDESSDHNFWCDLSMDVGNGGVFIATHKPLRLGTVVQVSVWLPNAETPIIVEGIVRWTRLYDERSDAPAGVGIKFCSPTELVSNSFVEFAETIRAPILFELEDVPMRLRARSTPRPLG